MKLLPQFAQSLQEMTWMEDIESGQMIPCTREQKIRRAMIFEQFRPQVMDGAVYQGRPVIYGTGSDFDQDIRSLADFYKAPIIEERIQYYRPWDNIIAEPSNPPKYFTTILQQRIDEFLRDNPEEVIKIHDQKLMDEMLQYTLPKRRKSGYRKKQKTFYEWKAGEIVKRMRRVSSRRGLAILIDREAFLDYASDLTVAQMMTMMFNTGVVWMRSRQHKPWYTCYNKPITVKRRKWLLKVTTTPRSKNSMSGLNSNQSMGKITKRSSLRVSKK
jgi:hypothetical protein